MRPRILAMVLMLMVAGLAIGCSSTPLPTYTPYPTYTPAAAVPIFTETNEPPPPADEPTMSEAEVFTRFSKEYIFKNLVEKLDELIRITGNHPVTDPDCGSIYEISQPNCDNFNFNMVRQAYLDMAWCSSIDRSRHEFTYEGKGTWLITVYPEDSES